MKTIEWTDVYPSGEHGQLYCEASDIGLPPGGWPHFLKTGIGNGRDFIKQYRVGEDYLYQQEGGLIRLLVIND